MGREGGREAAAVINLAAVPHLGASLPSAKLAVARSKARVTDGRARADGKRERKPQKAEENVRLLSNLIRPAPLLSPSSISTSFRSRERVPRVSFLAGVSQDDEKET